MNVYLNPNQKLPQPEPTEETEPPSWYPYVIIVAIVILLVLAAIVDWPIIMHEVI